MGVIRARSVAGQGVNDMPALKDLTGQQYGHLTVIGRDEERKGNITYWLCKCDCGNTKIISVARGSLTRGLTKSCGCLRKNIPTYFPNKYDLTGEYGIGWTSNTNKEFYFDLEDYDKIKDYCWYENDSGYIVTQRDRKTIRMHRIILGLNSDDKIQVDHIYHDKFDNRKEFLRLATNTQNNMNKKVKGVYLNKEKNKWVANITVNGVKHFKYFNNLDDAIEQRKKYEQKYFKEFAYKEKESA